MLNKQQQHGPAKTRLYLINLNDFFVHTLERGTKQRGDKSQSAHNCNKLQKVLTKMGDLIIYQQITSVEKFTEMCKERSNFNCTDGF